VRAGGCVPAGACCDAVRAVIACCGCCARFGVPAGCVRAYF